MAVRMLASRAASSVEHCDDGGYGGQPLLLEEELELLL
jgi:hypothetical protein